MRLYGRNRISLAEVGTNGGTGGGGGGGLLQPDTRRMRGRKMRAIVPVRLVVMRLSFGYVFASAAR
jgi:hypothetical protein